MSSPSIDSKRVYKAFIASPGDVFPEREAAFQVIDKINHTLDILKEPYRLDIYAWERNVYPDLGCPQGVISRQIPIEDCDIFVAVLWRRFGTPTGKKRPSDGRPYLSGTEQEIEEAISVRKKSKSERPIIMLYRKTDPLPTGLLDEDYLQYGDVIRLFRRFESEGDHPALVVECLGDQFPELLEDHLLRVAKKLDQDDRRRGPSPDGTPQPTKTGGDKTDPKTRWLERVQLKGDPFRHHIAEDEKETLPEYFVPLSQVPIREMVKSRRPWVVFAKTGCGKTALRTMLAKRCFPQDADSGMLSVTCARQQLNEALSRAGASLDKLDAVHYVQGIVKAVIVTVTKHTDNLSPTQDGWASDETWQALQAFASAGKKELVDPAQRLEACRRLQDVVTVAQNAGLSCLICLVDQVDEVHFVQGQPEKIVQLLEPLMRLELRETPGAAFYYFLPDRLEPLLQQAHDTFRLDRLQPRVVHLQWSEEDIQQLIGQRMTSFSRNQYTPYRSLGELCETPGIFAESIDAEIARLAEGSPRAAIWLAGQLIDLHCQASEPPRFIKAATWRSVVTEWELRGRSEVFGATEERAGFRLTGSRIHFQDQEVALPKQDHALLVCLVQADGKICSRDDLKRIAWSAEDPAGISDGAVTEAIRRLKGRLKKKGIDPAWIKTVRGRGYRLQDPESEERDE